MSKIEIITAWTDSATGMDKAEKRKAQLERQGYTLIHTRAYLYYSVFTYRLTDQ